MSGYFTIAHAAGKLGIPESELIESAEAGRITLVHLLRRRHHATNQGFVIEYFEGNTRMAELNFSDLLPAIVPKEWIYQLSQGESIWTNGAEIYGLGYQGFTWYRDTQITLADCRVPAGELRKPAEIEKGPKPKREREINRWLRETWKTLGRPGGSEFFRELKRYRGQPGSPIVDWYSAGATQGFAYRTAAGGSGSLSAKAVSNKVSDWKQTEKTCQ